MGAGHGFHQFVGGAAGVGGTGDGARDRHQQPQPVPAPARLERGGKVAALCAHAGCQDPQVGGGGAHAAERFGVGCAHHQPHVAQQVPFLRQPCHVFVEPAAGGKLHVLQVACAGVGGLAEQEGAMLRVCQEGFN